MIELNAPAKINLSLEIIKKREDGYHNIKSIFHKIDLFDKITLDLKNKSQHVNLKCNIESIPCDNKNTCIRAVNWFKNRFNVEFGLDIYLEKLIPTEAGLGGGSSDAATILKFLANEFHINIDISHYTEISKSIGADVPFFLCTDNAGIVEGVGEKITGISNTKPLPILLIIPPFGFSTKEMYSNLELDKVNKTGEKSTLLAQAIKMNFLKEGLSYSHNDFESVAVKNKPQLANLNSVVLATKPVKLFMTGSGATFVAVYDNEIILENAYREISVNLTDYKLIQSRLSV